MNVHTVRVLVVDDTTSMRHGLTLAARHLGCSVVGAASDGAEAVELARVLEPDLVVLDVQMPVMHGLDALTALRRSCPSAAVVMFSSDPTSRRPAMALGADGWCDKREGFVAPLRKGIEVLARRARSQELTDARRS